MRQVDRISNLPIEILHDILSRLPEEDAATTRVLSKAWVPTLSTFPMLSFWDCDYISRENHRNLEASEMKRIRKKFIDYVNKTLLRYNDQGLVIKGFKLQLNIVKYMSKDVDLWLKLACENGVEKLNLSLYATLNKRYWLPKGVMEAKSLTKLVLKGNIKIRLPFMNHSTRLFSLKVISLEGVLLDDEHAIQHFINSCPLIEYAHLRDCHKTLDEGTSWVFKSLRICGLSKLKVADFQGIQEVYMDSPSLEDFCYRPCHMHAPFKMELDGCKHLKRLTLKKFGTIIKNSWIRQLFLKFPMLESLKLLRCRMYKMVNISSRLKVLLTSNCSNMEEFNIDHHIFSFQRNSSELEVNVHITVDYNLHRFKEIIEKTINVFPSLSLCLPLSLITIPPNVDVVNQVIDLPTTSPLPIIKLLHLEVPDNESFFSSIVSIVFSCFCPEVIRVSHSSSKEFIVFLYEKLKRRKEDNCVCSSSDTKCWWHNLKSVKVTLTCSTRLPDNVDFMTMLESLPMDGSEGNVCFTLER